MLLGRLPLDRGRVSLFGCELNHRGTEHTFSEPQIGKLVKKHLHTVGKVARCVESAARTSW